MLYFAQFAPAIAQQLAAQVRPITSVFVLLYQYSTSKAVRAGDSAAAGGAGAADNVSICTGVPSLPELKHVITITKPLIEREAKGLDIPHMRRILFFKLTKPLMYRWGQWRARPWASSRYAPSVDEWFS